MPDHAHQLPTDAPRALIARAAGTNCDAELDRALTLAGARTSTVHLDKLCTDPAPIDQADIIAFPGGFSFGDDVASGRIFAMRTRLALADHLHAAVDRGARIIGICNGFQILVQAGLIPTPRHRTAALTDNAENRFIDRWVGVEINHASPCLWTQGLQSLFDRGGPDTAILPIANGEGRFVADQPTLDHLETNNLVAIRYTETVNGSANRIAGITDPTGRVLGLMPHPERYTDWNRHPFWTRLSSDQMSNDPPGLALFKNAVRAETPVA
ncbi:MAG: phosphoribosylformylglycinamidine synthase subunit PurQ [Planctomycetota bacterium]